nr:hypothetical protein [Candidatus Neomarinimicrobiota bacterium]
IDAGGNRTALNLDSDENEYSGYSNSSTKFIGFTFTDGDDDNPLINIDGPDAQSSSNSWDVTFENCRFTNTENDDEASRGIVVIVQSNTVFDGCTFRELNIDNNNSYGDRYAPIKLDGSDNSYWENGQYVQDLTIYEPQFKNCVIAENSVKSNANSNGNSYYGGGVYVGYGAIPYFENTRIDSNEIDPGSGNTNNNWWQVKGGGVYLSQMYNNGPPITFINCSISQNTIKGFEAKGGGVHTQYGQTQFINCVITGNEAEAGYPPNSNNYANAYGGGINYEFQEGQNENPNFDSKDPQLLIVNSTIANNVITPYTGGGSGNQGGAGISRNYYESGILMFNSIIYDNTITGESDYSSMNMSNSSSPFGDNEAVIGYSIIEYAEDSQIDGDEI